MVFKLHLVAPLLSFLPATSLAVPALRPCPHFWAGLDVAQSFYFFLKGSHHSQCFLVGLMYGSQTPLHQAIPFFPFGRLHFSRIGGLPARTSLWLWMSCPPSTLGGLQGRTPPLPVMLVPQEETLEVWVICRPPGIIPAVLFLRFLVPPAEHWVCPPLGSAEATSAGGLSRLSILPLSTLWLLHAETFHASLLSGEGCLLPIGPGSQGRAQCPSPTPSPRLTSPHQPPATWQPETSPSYFHIS